MYSFRSKIIGNTIHLTVCCSALTQRRALSLHLSITDKCQAAPARALALSVCVVSNVLKPFKCIVSTWPMYTQLLHEHNVHLLAPWRSMHQAYMQAAAAFFQSFDQSVPREVGTSSCHGTWLTTFYVRPLRPVHTTQSGHLHLPSQMDM